MPTHVFDDANVDKEVEEDEGSKRDNTVVAQKGEDERKGGEAEEDVGEEENEGLDEFKNLVWDFLQLFFGQVVEEMPLSCPFSHRSNTCCYSEVLDEDIEVSFGGAPSNQNKLSCKTKHK